METKFKHITLRIELDKEITLESPLSNTHEAARFFKDQIGNMDREMLALVCLDTKNNPLSLHLVSTGSLNNAIIHPREVFKTAILSNANKIMIAHNHPSGSVIPSQSDIETTLRLLDSGKILGIELLDHIIVGPLNEYNSFAQNSLLDHDLLQDIIQSEIEAINI